MKLWPRSLVYLIGGRRSKRGWSSLSMILYIPQFLISFLDDVMHRGEKVTFFWAKVPHLKNEKSISWMNGIKSISLLERKCPFCSSKDSVKAISEVIETPYFQTFSFGSWTIQNRLILVIYKSAPFGQCPSTFEMLPRPLVLYWYIFSQGWIYWDGAGGCYFSW
jgi:hypothetical protein